MQRKDNKHTHYVNNVKVSQLYLGLAKARSINTSLHTCYNGNYERVQYIFYTYVHHLFSVPAGHVPRIFARRHFVEKLEPTVQKKLSVIIVPCKAGTDLFHKKRKNKLILNTVN